MTLFPALLDCLAGAADSIALDMARMIQEEFPEYRDFTGDDQEQEWRTGLRTTLGLFIETAKANRSLNAEERRRIAVIGETRSTQGVPLDVVLGSVRLAMHVALSVVRRHTHELRTAIGFEEAMDEMSLRMTRFINEFSSEINRGHFARSKARVTSMQRDLAQFGSDLLAGAFSTHADIRRHGEVLGFTIPPTLGLALVPGPGAAHALLAADLAEALPSALIVPVGWGGDPHTVLVVPATTEAEWTEATKRVADVTARHRATALTTGRCEVPEELHRRYVEAAACLTLVPTFADGRHVVEAMELVPAQLVASGPRVALRAIERDVLLPLREHRKGPKLLRALDALMRADGSPKAAARLLGVASETARTYKATIEQVTRLCFDRPTDAMRLVLGWLVLRQFGENGLA